MVDVVPVVKVIGCSTGYSEPVGNVIVVGVVDVVEVDVVVVVGNVLVTVVGILLSSKTATDAEEPSKHLTK